VFQLNNAAPWGIGVVGQRHLPDRRIGKVETPWS
jgi:hypothetical protein